MKDIDKALTGNGLPDELLELLRKYPRDQWTNDARLHGLAEGWLQRHNLFRELSVLTGDMTTDLREGRTSPTTFLPLFQRRMGLLLRELDRHHHVEDDYYFPTFAAAVPKLQKGFDILDNDHGVIHGAIYRLGNASREFIAALSGEASRRDGDAPRVAELAGEIEGFDRTLLRHLDDEEDLIIPLILERTRDDPNFVRSCSVNNGSRYCGCVPDPPNVNPAAIKDVVMCATLARLARTSSIVDDRRIRPALADHL